MPLAIRFDTELESGLRASSAQPRTSRPKGVRQPVPKRVVLYKERKGAFEIARRGHHRQR